MKLSRDQIQQLNFMAKRYFYEAQQMLKGINFVLCTDYDWLNRRVAVKDEDGKWHDAYARAEKID